MMALACIAPPDPDPPSLPDLDALTASMHKKELAQGILLAQAAIALHGGCSIGANFDHGNAVKQSPVAL